MIDLGDWVYFALLWTAVMALPGAIRALPVSWRHWREERARRNAKGAITRRSLDRYLAARERGLSYYKALLLAWRYRKRRASIEVATSGGALFIALGIAFHAIEEIAYKSGRIWQLIKGQDTYGQAGGVLIFAGFMGIASLTLPIHTLNRANPTIPRIYWAGQVAIALIAFAL